MAFLHPATFVDLVAGMETFDNETNIFIEAHLIWICLLCSGICRRQIRDFEVVFEIPPIEVLSSAGLAHNTIVEQQLKRAGGCHHCTSEGFPIRITISHARAILAPRHCEWRQWQALFFWHCKLPHLRLVCHHVFYTLLHMEGCYINLLQWKLTCFYTIG